jgi:hypothetical protein
VVFHPATKIATVKPLFYDEAAATVANVGADLGTGVHLALTDPDSNEVVPSLTARFAGDFMLTSQADQEQIFLHPRTSGAWATGFRLSVLRLSQSVDDTAWARKGGRLFGTDASANSVDVITGPFRSGAVFVAVTPCDAGNAPATCPGPGFPPNYLGSLNPRTGHVAAVAITGGAFQPKGLLFIGG